MTYRFTNFAGVVLPGLCFAASGLVSFITYRAGFIYAAIFPGVFFTISTFVAFRSAGIPERQYLKFSYFVLMEITWLGAWILTLWSSWFVLIAGPIITALALHACIYIIKRLVMPLRANLWATLFVGGIPFLVSVGLNFIDKYKNYVTLHRESEKIEPYLLFSDSVFYWQVSAGFYLLFLLSANKKTTTRSQE